MPTDSSLHTFLCVAVVSYWLPCQWGAPTVGPKASLPLLPPNTPCWQVPLHSEDYVQWQLSPYHLPNMDQLCLYSRHSTKPDRCAGTLLLRHLSAMWKYYCDMEYSQCTTRPMITPSSIRHSIPWHPVTTLKLLLTVWQKENTSLLSNIQSDQSSLKLSAFSLKNTLANQRKPLCPSLIDFVKSGQA